MLQEDETRPLVAFQRGRAITEGIGRGGAGSVQCSAMLEKDKETCIVDAFVSSCQE